jgi:hypothetical protein
MFKSFFVPWIGLSLLPLIGGIAAISLVNEFAFLIIEVRRAIGFTIFGLFYLTSVILNIVLTIKANLRQDTKLLFYVLSFISPFMFWMAMSLALLPIVGAP